MNKRITQKVLTAVAITFFGLSVNAQILTDYVEAVVGGPEEIDTVTTGVTMRYYVLPDPVFSPSYDAATNTNLGVNQRWTWTSAQAAFTKAAANENFILFTAPAAGNYTTTVVETNLGLSCDDGGQTITIEVIPASTVIFTAADGGGIFGSAAAPFNLCETDLRLGTDNAQATLANAVLAATPSFQIQYALTVDTNQNGDGTWGNIAALTQPYLGTAGNQQAVTGTTHDLTLPAGGFVCITDGVDYPTRYTYTISGVTDRISRKGDYIANPTQAATGWTWYDTGAQSLVIVVNPVPVTGPIYHISNLWAN